MIVLNHVVLHCLFAGSIGPRYREFQRKSFESYFMNYKGVFQLNTSIFLAEYSESSLKSKTFSIIVLMWKHIFHSGRSHITSMFPLL